MARRINSPRRRADPGIPIRAKLGRQATQVPRRTVERPCADRGSAEDDLLAPPGAGPQRRRLRVSLSCDCLSRSVDPRSDSTIYSSEFSSIPRRSREIPALRFVSQAYRTSHDRQGALGDPAARSRLNSSATSQRAGGPTIARDSVVRQSGFTFIRSTEQAINAWSEAQRHGRASEARATVVPGGVPDLPGTRGVCRVFQSRWALYSAGEEEE